MSKAKKKRGSGGNPATAAQRRQAAQARGLALHDAFEKAQLDALHEVAVERFGLGIGVLLQEEERLKREAVSHRAEREQLPWRARLYWPFGQHHRLGRMQREAESRSEEWGRRLKMCALVVAKQADDVTVQAGLARKAVAEQAEGR